MITTEKKIRMYIQSYPVMEREYTLKKQGLVIPELPDIELIQLLQPLKINHPILQLLVYLDLHSGEKLYLDTVCYESCFTKKHFPKIFREYTGASFTSYMIRLRLHKAMYLLLNSYYSTYQISIITGFNTYSAFHKYFLLCYGLPPGKIRNW